MEEREREREKRVMDKNERAQRKNIIIFWIKNRYKML